MLVYLLKKTCVLVVYDDIRILRIMHFGLELPPA